MPTGHRSFYTDMASGPRDWTYISEELPIIAPNPFSRFPGAKRRAELASG